VDPVAKKICGGEEGGRFPGNLCIDGLQFPLVSSCRLIPAHSYQRTHSRLHFRVANKTKLPSKTTQSSRIHRCAHYGFLLPVTVCGNHTRGTVDVEFCVYEGEKHKYLPSLLIYTTETMVVLASAPQPIVVHDYSSL